MLRSLSAPLPGLASARGLSTAPPKYNWLLKLMGYYSEETTRIRNADAIFQSCANQASRKAWLSPTRGRVPDEFRPKHALLMTHVWLVHRRLDTVGDGEKELQEAVFDRLWEDTTHRIRATGGISELMVNSSLGDVQKYSVPLLLQLDQAMTKATASESASAGSTVAADEDAQADHLGAAVWRNVWLGSKNMTVEHCMELAAYLQRAKLLLAATEDQAVREGRIDWGEVPSWKGVKSVLEDPASDVNAALSGEARDAAAIEGAEAEEEGGVWRAALANTGKTYYWNIETRETRWEKPER